MEAVPRSFIPVAGVGAGRSAPLGATLVAGGVNFSIYSKHATHMDLLLFDEVDAAEPVRVIELSPSKHRTFHYWHAFVPYLKAGQIYAYRAYGANMPDRGLRFDPQPRSTPFGSL